MSSNLDLGNPINWTIKDSQFFTTPPETLLPEYLSVDLTSNIISVFVANSEALDTWNWAGWACQQIELPFGPNSSSTINYQKLWLRNKQLLIFPKIVTTYRLKVKFPKLFTQASITLWEYQKTQLSGIET